MADIGFVDAWAQLPVRGDQLVPMQRLLELFGSNFPRLPLERCAAEVWALKVPDEAMQKFLTTNALHVFGVS